MGSKRDLRAHEQAALDKLPPRRWVMTSDAGLSGRLLRRLKRSGWVLFAPRKRGYAVKRLEAEEYIDGAGRTRVRPVEE